MVLSGASAHELALNNAIGKAREAAKRHPNAIIIGVDTIGSYQDHILENPRIMLMQCVCSLYFKVKPRGAFRASVLLIQQLAKEAAVVESTHITFQPLSPEDIEAYVNTGESLINLLPILLKV